MKVEPWTSGLVQQLSSPWLPHALAPLAPAQLGGTPHAPLAQTCASSLQGVVVQLPSLSHVRNADVPKHMVAPTETAPPSQPDSRRLLLASSATSAVWPASNPTSAVWPASNPAPATESSGK